MLLKILLFFMNTSAHNRSFKYCECIKLPDHDFTIINEMRKLEITEKQLEDFIAELKKTIHPELLKYWNPSGKTYPHFRHETGNELKKRLNHLKLTDNGFFEPEKREPLRLLLHFLAELKAERETNQTIKELEKYNLGIKSKDTKVTDNNKRLYKEYLDGKRDVLLEGIYEKIYCNLVTLAYKYPFCKHLVAFNLSFENADIFVIT